MILKNVKIASPHRIINRGWIQINDFSGLIESVNQGNFDDKNLESTTTIIDGTSKIIIPAFIDLHCHGGYGYSFMDKNQPLETVLSHYSKAVLKEGVTNFCVGTVATSPSDLEHFLKQYKEYVATKPSETTLGIYLEAPFINKKFKGAHDERLLLKPNQTLLNTWHELSGNNLRIVAFAPELDQSFTKFLIGKNIIPSLAHSNANYYESQEAINNGMKNVTHFYNAMTGLNHRNPGVVPAVLANDDVTVELICDGIHVNPEILKLTYRFKGADKIIAVTDSVEAKGMPDGIYQLGSLPIEKKANKVCLQNTDTIAGSAATMLHNFNCLMQITNYDIQACVKMTSTNAARLLGKATALGDVAAGHVANLLVLDSTGTQIETVIKHGIPHVVR